MPVFNDAGRAFQRNWRWVLLFVAATAAASGLLGYCAVWTESVTVDKQIPSYAKLVGLIVDIVGAALASIFMALCFSEIGKEIDRPLWKCSGFVEAIKHYFILWFLLVLLSIANARMQIQAYNSDNVVLGDILEFVRLGLITTVVPVGACLMFHLGPNWGHVGEALSPLLRIPSATLGLILIGMFQWLSMSAFIMATPETIRETWWIYAVLNLPFSLLDCYVFCVAWHICVLDRNMRADNSGDDFDF